MSLYDLYQQTNGPDTLTIVDGWASDAAIPAHTAHPNVARVVDQLNPLLAAPLAVTTSIRLSHSTGESQ